MSPDPDFIVAPQTTTSVALEPAMNLLNSLLLLVKADDLPGVGTWVTDTLASLPPERRHRNELVTIGLHYALPPSRLGQSFPAYVDDLAAAHPVALRARLLARLIAVTQGHSETWEAGGPMPTPEYLVASLENYLGFLDASGFCFDRDLETEAHTYMSDPPAMQALIVEHLRFMWDAYLAEEWARVKPMLQESADACRQIDYSGKSPYEVATAITRQDVPDKWEPFLAEHERVIFAPSAHVGPYLGKLHNESTMWVFFGARLPEGARTHSPDLSRSELLVRLSALADDTRLRILALIMDEGELCAQEIIARLDLSQSAASRHLRQLSATGYLTERRVDGAKCYSLNTERIDDTCQALVHFLAQD